MKILIYFSGDIDESKGTPIRVRNIVKQLSINGAEVHYAGKNKSTNLNFYGFVKMRAPYTRVFDILKYIKNNRIDLVYLQTSSGLWLAPLLRFFTSAFVSCDFHSLNVEEEKFYKKTGFIRYYFSKYLEFFLCLFLDFATGVSCKLGEYYRRFIREYYILPGGVDLNLFNNQIAPDEDILRWKEKSILIGYAGNTKWYQGLNTVLEALKILTISKSDFSYKLLIIASSLEPEIASYIKKENLHSVVKIIDKQPHYKIPSLLTASDILTVVRPKNIITEYAFPSKFPEHAALGKALIVTDVGDITRYIKDKESALIIKPDNPNELAKAILSLNDINLYNKISKGSFNVAKNMLEINVLGSNFFNFINEQCKM